MKEELTTKQHNELLKNKKAEKLSDYVTYQMMAEAVGVEKALAHFGWKKHFQ